MYILKQKRPIHVSIKYSNTLLHFPVQQFSNLILIYILLTVRAILHYECDFIPKKIIPIRHTNFNFNFYIEISVEKCCTFLI